MRKHYERIAEQRKRRTLRVRKALKGTAVKPRLSVVKTNKHIFAQLINDETHQILLAVSSNSKEFRGTEWEKKSKATAKKLGEKIAELAKAKEIQHVIFDRGRFKYHGILAELADAARAGGLQF